MMTQTNLLYSRYHSYKEAIISIILLILLFFNIRMLPYRVVSDVPATICKHNHYHGEAAGKES